MKKETIYYLVGGAVAIGLGYMAYTKYKGNVAALQASLITGDSVPVDGEGNKAQSIPTEVVQKMTTAQVKEVTKTNPEVLAQITPAQAVDIINTTPGINAIIPKSLQRAIEQAAATGSTAPAASVAPPPAPVPVVVTPLPAPSTPTRVIATTPVAVAPKPVYTTVTAPVTTSPIRTTGSSGAESLERREFMMGLGAIEQLVL